MGFPYLEFTVPGKVASANRVTRRFGRRSVKSEEAVSYQQRVFQHAFAAAQAARWEKPEACGVDIILINARIDADNAAKCILDGMMGAIYDDDRCVLNLMINKYSDGGPERVVVVVHVRKPLPPVAERKCKSCGERVRCAKREDGWWCVKCEDAA